MSTPNELLDVTDNRFVLHPIKHPDIFEMGKKAIASFWQVEELDFNNDVQEFQRMSADEKHFVLQILAFFASADGIVIENLVENFCGRQLPEALLLQLPILQRADPLVARGCSKVRGRWRH